MAIILGAEFRIHQKREEVYHFLTDPNRFAPLLPDFESMTVDDERHYTVNVKVGIAYIRGTATDGLRHLHATFFVLSEVREPERRSHTGLMNLMKGMFGVFRNVTAHASKVSWTITEQDALDLLTIASFLHRRLDDAVRTPRTL